MRPARPIGGRSGSQDATVSGLYIYPIKSCAPVAVSTATVERQGLRGDRRFMVVDRNGRFVTARTQPRLVLVASTLDDDALTIRAPGMAPVRVDLARIEAGYRDVSVWRDSLAARSCGPEAARLFSDYLGGDYALVHKDAATVRPGKSGGEVSFADAHPLLVLSDASVDDLNARLARPVDRLNFRPNICLSGLPPGGEDRIARLTVGSVTLQAAGPCSRCVLTTVDPATGTKDPHGEPMRTLGTFRRGADRRIYFGQNMAPLGAGVIALGDVAAGDAPVPTGAS